MCCLKTKLQVSWFPYFTRRESITAARPEREEAAIRRDQRAKNIRSQGNDEMYKVTEVVRIASWHGRPGCAHGRDARATIYVAPYGYVQGEEAWVIVWGQNVLNASRRPFSTIATGG